MDAMDYQERVLNSLDKLTNDVNDIKVDLAALPSQFVTKDEIKEAKKESTQARRFAITSILVATGIGVGVWQGFV